MSEPADSHTLPVVLGLTADDLRAAGTACEAQGNIHDRMQAEEEGGATVQSTRGKHWHDLAVKFSTAWYAAQQSLLPVVRTPQETDTYFRKQIASFCQSICEQNGTNDHVWLVRSAKAFLMLVAAPVRAPEPPQTKEH